MTRASISSPSCTSSAGVDRLADAELADRDDAFGLVADVDQDLVLVDAHHFAGDDVAFAEDVDGEVVVGDDLAVDLYEVALAALDERWAVVRGGELWCRWVCLSMWLSCLPVELCGPSFTGDGRRPADRSGPKLGSIARLRRRGRARRARRRCAAATGRLRRGRGQLLGGAASCRRRRSRPRAAGPSRRRRTWRRAAAAAPPRTSASGHSSTSSSCTCRTRRERKLALSSSRCTRDHGDLDDVGGAALQHRVHGQALAQRAHAVVAGPQLGHGAAAAEQRRHVAVLRSPAAITRSRNSRTRGYLSK